MAAAGNQATPGRKPGAVDRCQLVADIRTLAEHWNLDAETRRFQASPNIATGKGGEGREVSRVYANGVEQDSQALSPALPRTKGRAACG